MVDTGMLLVVWVPKFNELVGVNWSVFTMGLDAVYAIYWVTQFVDVFKRVRTVRWITDVDRLVEEVVLGIMALEEVLDVEAKVEAGAELEVVEVVGVVGVVEEDEESTAELDVMYIVFINNMVK